MTWIFLPTAKARCSDVELSLRDREYREQPVSIKRYVSKELDEKAAVQFQSTTSDIFEWLDENFWYTEEPSWVSLSAKVEKKSTNNTDYMWYAGIAGTTLALMLCASMLSTKKEEKAVKYDQVAEALVSQQ